MEEQYTESPKIIQLLVKTCDDYLDNGKLIKEIFLQGALFDKISRHSKELKDQFNINIGILPVQVQRSSEASSMISYEVAANRDRFENSVDLALLLT